MTWMIVLIAIAAGAANPFQSGTNAELNKQFGAPLWAGMVVYASGLPARMAGCALMVAGLWIVART